MAISTAAAIIGSAVVGAGASALSSSKAAKAAKNASNYAADQNAQVSREIYNQTRSDLAPYNQAGQGALSALMVRLGIQPMSGPNAARPMTQPAQPQTAPGGQRYQTRGMGGQQAPAGYYFGPSDELLPIPGGQAANEPMGADGGRTSVIANQGFGGYNPIGTAPGGGGAPQAAPQGGGADWQAYLDANPDVKANAEQRAAAEGVDPLVIAQEHYNLYGKSENRALPMAPQDQYYQEDYGQRPDAMPAPTFQRGADVQFQDYGTGPQVADFIDPSKFQVDPGYQFRLSEGLNSVNAASAARGKLRSGDAARALQQRGEGLANQGYNDWYQRQMQAFNASRGTFQDNRNFGTDQSRYTQDRGDRNFIDDRSYGTNLWNTQQNRQDNIFSEDRGFTAGRNDQATSNLFGLAGMGQNAAAQAGNAGNVFAQNTINSNNQRASNTANAAIANSANMTNLFGSAANAIGTYYGMRGSGSSAPLPRVYNI